MKSLVFKDLNVKKLFKPMPYNWVCKMRHGSLFSGIGGFDLAAEWMGWENKFHCENNTFCKHILKHYWPNAESYDDIKTADFKKWRGFIDIISGGFPCQPYSAAGKRKGKEDERHLWPEMLKAIRTIQPRYVVGENVYGLVNWSRGLVFDEVQADLENEGYQVTPYILPACAVNAPHRRDRIWFVAHAKNNTRNNGIGNEGQESQTVSGKRFNELIITPNTGYIGQEKPEKQSVGIEQLHEGGNTTDTSSKGLQGRAVNGTTERIGKNGEKQFNRFLSPNWEGFPTQPPVRSRNDGLPGKLAGITFSKHRNESIKAYGNAIVPQVAFEIFKAIESYEKAG